jgi:hypothetical protein
MLKGTSTDTLCTLQEYPAMVLVSAVGVTDALIWPVEVLPRTSWSLAWGVIVASFFLASSEIMRWPSKSRISAVSLSPCVMSIRIRLPLMRVVCVPPMSPTMGAFPVVVEVTVTSAAAGAATRQASTKARAVDRMETPPEVIGFAPQPIQAGTPDVSIAKCVG